jgi:hypothetical protein
MSKANTVTKLEVLLETTDSEKISEMLANWMSSSELDDFLEFVKEELNN